MQVIPKYKLIFYGDDFTGSTDALEFLCLYGARAVLFMEVPDQAMLERFPGIDAFGVAGKTRSLATNEMKEVLEKDFVQLSQFQTAFIHYKVCSTFDSSPSIGSIGMAMDLGAAIFKTTLVPVLGGMPLIGRYCVFSNLFVRMGIGTTGAIHRLDRHPSMSKHPVTPADEADLRLHLGRQTTKHIGAIDIDLLQRPYSAWLTHLQADEEAVVLDAMTTEDLMKIGAWLDERSHHASLFTIGSSGIEAALCMYWKSKGMLNGNFQSQRIKKEGAMLVVSGSQSPITQEQIEFARSHGYPVHVITADALAAAPDASLIDTIVKQSIEGKPVVVHSGSRNASVLDAELLGNYYGKLVREISSRIQLGKLIVCGGDTSSHAARALGIIAVEMIGSYIHGAPLCRAYSSYPEIDGMEMNFKGGQVGPPEYFEVIKTI
jgi:3-oxoisoapionate kinase